MEQQQGAVRNSGPDMTRMRKTGSVWKPFRETAIRSNKTRQTIVRKIALDLKLTLSRSMFDDRNPPQDSGEKTEQDQKEIRYVYCK